MESIPAENIETPVDDAQADFEPTQDVSTQTDEIVMLGGADRTTSEVNKLLGQLPPAVSALTGVDLSGALGKIPGATMKTS